MGTKAHVSSNKLYSINSKLPSPNSYLPTLTDQPSPPKKTNSEAPSVTRLLGSFLKTGKGLPVVGNAGGEPESVCAA